MSRSVELTHREPCSVANTFVDENGLLFLPAAGHSVPGLDQLMGLEGYYSSITAQSETFLNQLRFSSTLLKSATGDYGWRYARISVRLVCLAQ